MASHLQKYGYEDERFEHAIRNGPPSDMGPWPTTTTRLACLTGLSCIKVSYYHNQHKYCDLKAVLLILQPLAASVVSVCRYRPTINMAVVDILRDMSSSAFRHVRA